MNGRSLIAWAILGLFTLLPGCSCGKKPPVGLNEAPSVQIDSPADGFQERAGTPVSFSAMASDPEDGALDGASVVWTSSLEGQLFTGASNQAALSQVGSHVITVTATDSSGEVASASITILVLDPRAPTVVITKPANGAVANLGEVLDFWCTATTYQGNPILDSNIQWASKLSGPLPAGSKVKAALTVSGADTVTCTATDLAVNVSASVSVSVSVTTTRAPLVQITTPKASEIWIAQGLAPPYGPAVTFRATAQDWNVDGGAGNLDPAIQWTLDPGNVSLGTGPTAAHTFSALGDYTVTARAVDSLGSAGTDTVIIHMVANIPPQCTINRPRNDGTLIQVNVPYQLQGTCFDPETNQNLQPTWTTSAQVAPLGTGGNVNATFTVNGDQTLSACRVDPQDANLTGCAQRPIRVFTNTPPSNCAIQAPAGGASLNAGVPVVLKGSAADAESPQADLTFSWTSSVDNQLATGADTTTTQLRTPGPHQLTLTVTDPWNASCSASIQVTLNAAPAVQITSLLQGTTNCVNTSCQEALAVDAVGTANDPQGIATSSWSDSVSGSFGSGLTATLSSPVVGKHMILFEATDTLGAVGRATQQIVILAAGKQRLVETLLNTGNPVESLAVTGLSVDLMYVDRNSQSVRVYKDPGGAQNSIAISDVGRSLFPLLGGTLVVFAGTDGSGVDRCVGTACTNYRDGLLTQANNVVRALAATADPDLLLIGTGDGLILTRATDPSLGNPQGNVQGRLFLQGSQVRAIGISPLSTAALVKAFVATDNGLEELTVAVAGTFDPMTASVSQATHTAPEVMDDSVYSIAFSPEGKVFAGTRRGFSALGEVGPDVRSAPWNFPDNEIRALLFERRNVSGAPRDLLWAGSRDGLIRFDLVLGVPSRLTQADGLPSTDIRSLALGPAGVKYIGTASGLAKYSGY